MSEPAPGEPAATPKVVAYTALTGIGLLAAVVFSEVTIVALAAPFAFALVIGLLSPVPELPKVRVEVDEHRLIEGGRATIAVEMSAPSRVPQCNVSLTVPRGLRAEVLTDWSLRLEADSSVLIEVPFTADRYGRFVIEPVAVSVPGRFGLLSRRGTGGEAIELEVRPKPEALRTVARAAKVRATAGDRLARHPGDGIEFAEVRPYTPGSPGRINWRVTARRSEPYVNLRHPERSTDLILLVDTFSAALLPRQARAAAGLAAAALTRHDRVGLVGFGGVLHWVDPGMGQVQLERIVAALTATKWHHSYAWKTAETIPSRTLPPTGLVIAISPLDDPRMLSALATIRARGVDLAVIETIGAPPTKALSSAGYLAARLIELERNETRDNLSHRGVPVIAWREGESLETALGALVAWRRRARGRVVR
jgi:uncharacterized protein (DUF58 family)